MPFGLYDPDGKLLGDYTSAGITAVALLAELEECREKTGRDLLSIYQEQRFTVFSLPIVNYGVPARNRLPQLLMQVQTYAAQGHNIAIHCSAGLGRTALIAALLAKTILRLSGLDAIKWLGQHQPGALLTPAQIALIMGWAT